MMLACLLLDLVTDELLSSLTPDLIDRGVVEASPVRADIPALTRSFT